MKKIHSVPTRTVSIKHRLTHEDYFCITTAIKALLHSNSEDFPFPDILYIAYINCITHVTLRAVSYKS